MGCTHRSLLRENSLEMVYGNDLVVHVSGLFCSWHFLVLEVWKTEFHDFVMWMFWEVASMSASRDD